jgi:hypothetical protein
MIRLSACVILALVLSGCAAHTSTKVNTFRSAAPIDTKASILVVADQAEQGASLEFAHHKQLLENRLRDLGFTVTNDTSARYQARLSYTVTRLSDKPRPSPRTGAVVGLGQTDLSYGTRVVVVDEPAGQPNYERRVSVIFTEQGTRVYEVYGTSDGPCAVMSGVFPDILAALFSEFPAENGQYKNLRVPTSTSCK